MRSCRVGLTLVFVTLAGPLSGCGRSQDNVGVRWAHAVDAEHWSTACALMPARRHCTADLRRIYAGRRVRLLPRGDYQQGSDVTDNVKRFAVAAEAGREKSTTYYEVEPRGGRDVVLVKVVVGDV